MKNIIEKHIKENKNKYIFFMIIFLVGIVIGALAVNKTRAESKDEISFFITEFITNIKNNASINYFGVLKESIKKNIIFICLIIIISFSVWGKVCNTLLIAYRGFGLGYSLASVVYVLGFGKGIMFSVSLLFLSQIVLIPAILYIIISCMNTYKIIILNEYDDIKFLIIKVSISIIITVFFALFSSLIQTFLCSNLFVFFTNMY